MNESEAKAILEAEAAAASERLLWWGRPAAGRLALRSLPAAVFGVPFTAFAAFWMWAAGGGLGGGRPPDGPMTFFPLFGLPFLLVGLGMLLSPLLAAAAARRTLYAVTSGGILFVKAGRTRRVERRPLPGGDVLQRRERPDGSGDLVVAKPEAARPRGWNVLHATTFVGIPQVARVERIVADATQGRHSGPATEPRAPIGTPGAPPATPTFGRAPESGRTPSYRAPERGRASVFVVLLVGMALGFALALALARAGRLPIIP